MTQLDARTLPHRIAHLAVDHVKDAIAWVTPDDREHLRLRYVNAAFERMFGWPASEAQGAPFDLLFPERAAVVKKSNTPSQVARRGATRLLARDGSEILVDLDARPVAIDGEDGTLLVMRDVTEQRRLEQIAAASVVSDSVGYFFAGIRHELGNPVNSLKAALTLLGDPLVQLPEDRRRDYLRRAVAEVSRMEALLEQLRTFNTNENVRPERIGVRAFLDRFARIAREDCTSRGATLVLEPVPDADVTTDARLVQQILLLLLANALDAVAGLPVREIRLVATRSARETTIALWDSGPGLTAEQLANVQRPFVTTKPKGTGLGLPLAHRYAALNGCRLELASEPGVGTRCTLHFEPLDSSEL
jgi:PAS domain S-box-containing protein